MDSIRRKLLLLSLGFFCLFLFAVGSFGLHSKGRNSIVIGGKGVEGEILAEILAQRIEAVLGVEVERECHVEGTLVIFQALKAKQLDLYVEYTGTALSSILSGEIGEKTAQEIYEEVQERLLEKYGLVALPPLGFQNRYAIMMRPETAEKYGIETLSDLSSKREGLQIGFDQEFSAREEFEILRKKYALSTRGIKLMDHVLLYLSLERGGCDVINGYSTDGFCKGLKLLKDDRGFFPSYEAFPLVSKGILEKHPKLEEVIRGLAGKISSEDMQEMNYAVEKKGEAVYDVASTFLKQCDLLAHD